MFNQILSILLPLCMAFVCYLLAGLGYHLAALVLPLFLAIIHGKWLLARVRPTHWLMLGIVVAGNLVLHGWGLKTQWLVTNNATTVFGVTLWAVIPAIAYWLLLHDVMPIARLSYQWQLLLGAVLGGVAVLSSWLLGAEDRSIWLALITVALTALATPLQLRVYVHRPSKRSPLKA